MVADPEERSAFFDFSLAPHGRSRSAITHLYLHVHKAALDPGNQPLRDFLSEAHAHGLAVELLCGDPSWAIPSGRQSGKERTEILLSFNRSVEDTEGFDGIHFDVEPYGANGWKNHYTTYWSQYLELLEYARGRLDSYNSTTGARLTLATDIPRWYDVDAVDGPGAVTSHEDVLRIVDYIVVMDYTDTAAAMVDAVANEIDSAEQIGKAVVLGVRTGRTSAEGAGSQTFFEEGNAYLERQLRSVALSFRRQDSFKGFAVHHLGTYERLGP